MPILVCQINIEKVLTRNAGARVTNHNLEICKIRVTNMQSRLRRRLIEIIVRHSHDAGAAIANAGG